MPLIGDKSLFAIEWNIARVNLDYEWINFCFWAHGIQIGDSAEETILFSTTSYLQEFLSHYQDRNIELLNGRSCEEIFSYIYEPLYSASKPRTALRIENVVVMEPNRKNYEQLSRLRNLFHLNDVGGCCFEGIGIVLINDTSAKSQRLIWQELDDTKVYEATMPERCFDEVAGEFLNLVEHVK